MRTGQDRAPSQRYRILPGNIDPSAQFASQLEAHPIMRHQDTVNIFVGELFSSAKPATRQVSRPDLLIAIRICLGIPPSAFHFMTMGSARLINEMMPLRTGSPFLMTA